MRTVIELFIVIFVVGVILLGVWKALPLILKIVLIVAGVGAAINAIKRI